MKFIKIIKTFLLMHNKTRFLLIESFFYLGWARVLKSKPFTRLAPKLGIYMDETPLRYNESKKTILRNVSQTINIVSRYTIWESKCLVRAIAAMKMLERRKIESTLYLGTAKDETGKMIAHAWLRSGPFYVTGAEEMERFIVVAKFAQKIGCTEMKEI